jgi:hypothetical protein
MSSRRPGTDTGSTAHLAYDLANGYETTMSLTPRRAAASLARFTTIELEPGQRSPDGGSSIAGSQLFDAHGMQPDVVFGVLAVGQPVASDGHR